MNEYYAVDMEISIGASKKKKINYNRILSYIKRIAFVLSLIVMGGVIW